MPPSPFPTRALALIVAAALLGLGAALAGFDPGPDESWMVLVAHRIAHGERLYQDVFCGVTPLAFQLQWAIQTVLGPGIAVLRGLSFILYALSALVVLATGITLRLSRFQLAFLLAASLFWTVPSNSSSYNSWALLFTLCAQYSVLRLLRSPKAARWAAAAGVCCGLAFATKQNIGLLCFAALGLGLLLARRRLFPLAAVSFGLAAAIPLLPIALTGGLPALLHYGFFNKTVYAQVAGISYLANLHFTPLAFWRDYGFPAGTLDWGRSLLYLAPVFLLAAPLPGRKVLGPPHAAFRTQLIFTIVSLGFVYPRWDQVHMAICAPFLALSLASLLPPFSRRWASAVLGAFLLLQFVVWGILILRPLPANISGLKAFHTLRVSPGFAANAAMAANRLPSEQRDPRGIFVLHPAAATIYLSAGIRNPTPYDYPLNSAFGPHGQQQLIEQLRAGLIPAVCLPDKLWTTDLFWPRFAPSLLINYVRTAMEPGPDLSICRIYRPR